VQIIVILREQEAGVATAEMMPADILLDDIKLAQGMDWLLNNVFEFIRAHRA
jgi:hypothetical protein